MTDLARESCDRFKSGNRFCLATNLATDIATDLYLATESCDRSLSCDRSCDRSYDRSCDRFCGLYKGAESRSPHTISKTTNIILLFILFCNQNKLKLKQKRTASSLRSQRFKLQRTRWRDKKFVWDWLRKHSLGFRVRIQYDHSGRIYIQEICLNITNWCQVVKSNSLNLRFISVINLGE